MSLAVGGQLQASGVSRVTVRIEEETQADEASLTQNPLFGMWGDHPDMQACRRPHEASAPAALQV